jgi:hypothetical protein
MNTLPRIGSPVVNSLTGRRCVVVDLDLGDDRNPVKILDEYMGYVSWTHPEEITPQPVSAIGRRRLIAQYLWTNRRSILAESLPWKVSRS